MGSAVFRLLRPHQWSKNLLVLLPVLVSHNWSNPGAWRAALAAFVAFCLAASSVYVLNDLRDRVSDRRHPRKSRRPFASGDLAAVHAAWLIPLLALPAVAIAAWLGPRVLLSLLAYLAVAWGYCFFFRGWLWADALALAGLYTLRVIAGCFAIAVVPSPWLLGFSIFLFFSLAAVKRQQDLSTVGTDGSVRAYRQEDVPVVLAVGLASGVAAVLVLALYLNSDDMLVLYRQPHWLWLICPLLLYWLARLWTLAHRGELDADPVVFALRDRASWVLAALSLLCIALGT
jgi:4-hydroxybenzoate polyprenyltransferase